MHPVAAPARVDGTSLQVPLLAREPSKPTRNGARVYLANSCSEASVPTAERYLGEPLLGRTLSVTVDLSRAGCGCNAAFYLVAMRRSPSPGQCDADYYCDANDVCGVRCAEVCPSHGLQLYTPRL